MEDIEPTNLVETARKNIGFDHQEIYEVFSQDDAGNIWSHIERDGHCGRLKLHMKAEQVVWPTLSFQQMLEMAEKQQKASDS